MSKRLSILTVIMDPPNKEIVHLDRDNGISQQRLSILTVMMDPPNKELIHLDSNNGSSQLGSLTPRQTSAVLQQER